MKIVLTQDVKDLGRVHETIEAKDGYALNYLIPKKFAIPATPAAHKEAEARLKARSERRALNEKLFAEDLIRVAEKPLTIPMRANEQGHLYEAVDATKIAGALAAMHIEIPATVLQLEGPIKALGTYRVPVAHEGVFGEFSIEVVAA